MKRPPALGGRLRKVRRKQVSKYVAFHATCIFCKTRSNPRGCHLRQSGDFSTVGADILLRNPVAVDIAVTHSSYCAKLHRNGYTDILGNSEETKAVFHPAAYLTVGSDHRIAAAFGSGDTRLSKGGHSYRNADGGGLIAYGRTSLRSIL